MRDFVAAVQGYPSCPLTAHPTGCAARRAAWGWSGHPAEGVMALEMLLSASALVDWFSAGWVR